MSEDPEGVELTGQSSLDISSTLVAEGSEGIGIAGQTSSDVSSALVVEEPGWMEAG